MFIVITFVLVLHDYVCKVSAQHGYISLNARALSETQVLVSRYDVGGVELANLDFAVRREGESGWRTTRFNPTREYFAYEYLNSSTLYYFRLQGRQIRTYHIQHAYTHIRTPPYTQQPPANVTAVAQSDGSVHVTWSPELDGRVLGYLVIYTEVDSKDRSLNEYKVKPVFRTTQTTLRDISGSSRYKVEVASVSLDGEGLSKRSIFIGREREPFLRITIPPHDVSVKDEGTVILACGVEGFPDPKVVWRKSGRRLDDRKRRILEDEHNGTSILRIEPIISRQDRGTYTCTASNSLGMTEKARAVIKTYKQNENPTGYPVISQHPVLQYVEEGSKVVMNCSAVGSPDVTTRWYRNSFPVYDSKDNRVSIGANARLLIRRVERSDEGTYECAAENRLGVAFSYPAHLYVRERLQRTMAPAFLRVRRGYKVPYGAEVMLPCDAIGEPVPDVWWEKQGERLRRRSHNGHNLLMLQDVRESSEYTCVASNTLDTIRRNYTVSVVNPPVARIPSPPVFKPLNLTMNVRFRASVRLPCEADGEPVPDVVWTDHEGAVVKTKSRHGLNLLRLYYLRRSVSYTCVASNTEGKISQVVTINVAPRGDMVDRPIRLKTTRVGFNEIEIEWAKPKNTTDVIGYVVYVTDMVAKDRNRTDVHLAYRHTFTNLLANNLYHIRVSSMGRKQEGLSTKHIEVRTLPSRRGDVLHQRPPA